MRLFVISQFCSGDAEKENVHNEATLVIRAKKTEEIDQRIHLSSSTGWASTDSTISLSRYHFTLERGVLQLSEKYHQFGSQGDK